MDKNGIEVKGSPMKIKELQAIATITPGDIKSAMRDASKTLKPYLEAK